MYKAEFKRHDLKFINPAGTSRGILNVKPSWIIRIQDLISGFYGYGECSIIPGLSIDDPFLIEEEIEKICVYINEYGINKLSFSSTFPAIEFGFTIAIEDLKSGGKGILYPSEFTEGKQNININGLIWMGDKNFMLKQVKKKVNDGFSCIKIKIGAINFYEELEILKFIRLEFPHKNLEIRVDANGAFSPEEALEKINALSAFNIHSIEQPIMPGQYEAMKEICKKSKIPVALDEELIGVSDFKEKEKILSLINPQYIILKPGLIGGFKKSEEWISLAKKYNIDWWITSALEGSVGLNAIAQWTYSLSTSLPQGLGTGALYTNNLSSPLSINCGELVFDPSYSSDWNKFFDDE